MVFNPVWVGIMALVSNLDWELHIKQMMAEDNRHTVEAARNTEYLLQINGQPFSQHVIDICNAWLQNPVGGVN